MADKGGFEYLDSVSKDDSINKDRLSNLQTNQKGMEEAPSEGGGGYVGGNPNASTVGTEYVTGKKGYSMDKPIWSTQSSYMGAKENSGSEDGDEKNAGTDSTDEKATYKKPQNDEGLIQTYRTADGAGDAGPSGSDEPDKERLFGGIGDGGGKPDTQSVPTSGSSTDEDSFSAMPQTEFTSIHGGGAPIFKHRG